MEQEAVINKAQSVV
ncbi:hypothetical protein EC902281_5423, partial [Escherichia coli 90.2281]